MIRFIIILTLIATFACSKTKKTRERIKASNFEIVDSVMINNLLTESNKYLNHWLIDLDNDNKTELLIISESDQKSDCLSMWDTTCVFMDIDLYKQKNDNWELIKNYQIKDSKNTDIKIDSSLNLIITQISKPSGLSNKNKIEYFDFKDGDFYLREIDLTVDTKLNSSLGTDKDNWKYSINLKSNKIRLDYSEFRLFKDINGEPDLVKSDTMIFKELTNDISIKLGQSYETDSLLIDGYEIQY